MWVILQTREHVASVIKLFEYIFVLYHFFKEFFGAFFLQKLFAKFPQNLVQNNYFIKSLVCPGYEFHKRSVLSTSQPSVRARLQGFQRSADTD